MKNLLFLSCLLNTACLDFLKSEEEEEENDDDERREGERQGDCFDGEDNDDDDKIDCDDSGCSDKPACNDTASEETGIDDTGIDDTGIDDTGIDDTSEPEVVEATLDPDYLYFQWSNGYIGNEIVDMTFEAVPDYTGNIFTAILYNSNSTDVCIIDWSFDATSVEFDPEYTDGSVGPDALEGWYGYLINSIPTTRESCDNLGSGQLLFDSLIADQPGFGYGPLNEDLEETMIGSSPNWEDLAPVVFAGIVAFTSDSERMYYAINQAFAYEVTDNAPAWDPANNDTVQGTEMAIEEVPFAEGFYVGSLFYSFTLTQ